MDGSAGRRHNASSCLPLCSGAAYWSRRVRPSSARHTPLAMSSRSHRAGTWPPCCLLQAAA
eukprot:2263717-Prymnesium_polylepis.1